MNITLTCVRHGQTIHNRDSIIQGWIGSQLTELGQEQAFAFADSVEEAPSAIFYSDLRRCVQTVQPLLAKFPTVPAFADWRLRERSFGTVEGLESSSIDWPGFFEVDRDDSPYGGEPESHFEERVKSFMRDISLSGFTDALIVTHSGTLNRFHFIMDKDHVYTPHENTGTITLTYDPLDERIAARPAVVWEYPHAA